MVLSEGHGPDLLAPDEAHQGAFLAAHVILDDHPGPGLTETPVDEHLLQGIQGLIQGHGHGHPLAGSQSVGLDHNRCAMLPYVLLCRFQAIESGIGGGGNPMAPHQGLGEVLGSFNLRGSPGGAESAYTGLGQVVDQAFDQGLFGANEDPIDGVLMDIIHYCRRVRRVQVGQMDAIQGHTWIARGAEDLVHGPPGQECDRYGMFPGSRTDDQNPIRHSPSPFPIPTIQSPRVRTTRSPRSSTTWPIR